MEGPVLTIGRSNENDLCINGKFISRRHAVLVRHGAEVFVTDLGSTNGTYVNSHRIQDPVLIKRDTILVGGYRIKFNNPNACDSTAPQGTELNNSVIINGLKKMRDVLGRKNRPELPFSPAFRRTARDSDGSLS
jgi:pSer/pThr/pTyr-binding forkhead associated (FHA) protein